jgi:pyruvate/2-oxoglutarate dehydrogenase complex dihydrolipoamide acyltransferase (E2) component
MIYRLVVPPPPDGTEGEEELRVLQWHKAVGDRVSLDELLVELETSKAIVEVRARREAVLRQVLAATSGWVKAGETIALLSDTPDEAVDASAATEMQAHYEIT